MRSLLAPCSLVLLLALPAAAGGILPETMDPAMQFQVARWGQAVVGPVIYGGGGLDHTLTATDSIVRLTPQLDRWELVGHLAQARYADAAVAYDTKVLFIGGYSPSGGFLTTMEEYDVLTGDVETKSARLPIGLAAMSAVWTGEEVLIFGGDTPLNQNNRQILAYDPQADTTPREVGRLPVGKSNMATAWDGERAYLVGGVTDLGVNTREIIEYDPVSGQLAVRSNALPERLGAAGATWVETCGVVRIYGGHDGTAKASVLEFVPGAATAQRLPVTLPTPRWHVAAAQLGTDMYVVGGLNDDGSETLLMAKHSRSCV